VKCLIALSSIATLLATALSVGDAQEVLTHRGADVEGRLLTSIGSKIDHQGDVFTLAVRYASGNSSLIQGRVASVISATPRRKAIMQLRIYGPSASRAQESPARLEVTSFVSTDGNAELAGPSIFISTTNGDFVVEKGTLFRLTALMASTAPYATNHEMARNASLTATPSPVTVRRYDTEYANGIPVKDYW
jgi:hypothetical protein